MATGFIRFDNGATIQIEFSWASNVEDEMNFVELRGTKAGLILMNDDLKIFMETAGMLTDLTPRIGQNLPGQARNIHHFIDCIQKRAEPVFKPEEGLNMIKIISAIYESARQGNEVKNQ